MKRERLAGLSASWRDTWKATDPANRVQDEEAMKMYLRDNGIKVNADGTVTLYHATHKESAASIKKDGFFKPTTGKNIMEKIDNAAWFSTDKEWVKIWGHTKTPTILTVKVPAIYLRHMPLNFKEFYFEGGLHKRDGYWTPVRAPKENWVMKIARRNWEEVTERLGYVPTPRERGAGKRLFYMLQRDWGGRLTTLPRKDRLYWINKSGKYSIKVYGLFAYSADDAREQIGKGNVPPIHEEGGKEAQREALVRPSYRPERVPLSRKPVKWFYMFVKKGFRKPKSVGIHEASFYQREMSQGRGTLYQVKARTAEEARALIKAGKKEPARLAPKTPRRTEAEKEALWDKLILEAARTKYLDLDVKLRPILTPEQLKLFGKVSYMPQAWERARGERNYYLHAAYLSDGSILFIEKHTVGEWLNRKETEKVEYHAVNAYSREHAQMIIEAGNSRPYHISPGRVYAKTPVVKMTPEQLRLFGLRGDISTCTFWIPTNGDWTCGGYAPTCEAQSPGACVIPPPDQYKFCATTQKVKSDPKGRYRGKLITRCKTYRSRCMPDSKCIEDKLFPKPEVFKLDKKQIQEIAASMAKEFNLLQKETGPALSREIMDRGGLKAYRGEVESEEWAEIPLHLKRKSGMALDEMASEMGFDDDQALRFAIEKAYPKGVKTVRRKTWKDYQAEAEQVLIDEQQRSEYAYEEPVPF